MTFKKSLVIFAACGALLGGCHRKSGPSPQYAQAHDQWSQVLKDHQGDESEASVDARVSGIRTLLAAVPADSVDAPYAKELSDRIEQASAAQAARAAATEALVKAAIAPPTAGGFAAPSINTVVQAKTGEKAEAVAAVAKADEATEPKAGMPEAEFNQKFSRCFEYRSDFATTNGGRGQVFGLRDLSLCRDKYPSFLSNSVMVAEGKVFGVGPAAELTPKKFVVVDGKQMPFDEYQAQVADKQKKEAADRAAKDKAAADQQAAEEAARASGSEYHPPQ